jgi:Fe-S cluster assembly protein SufD
MVTTELIQKDNFSREAFDYFHSQAAQSSAPWFRQLQESAIERFVEVGFPTVKDEEWKYTNVAPLVKTDFEFPSTTPSALEIGNLSSYPETAKSRVVFINGRLENELSDLSAVGEVVLLDLQTAIRDERFGELIREHLGHQADYVTNSFTALNTAFATDGAFVYIPSNTSLASPVHLAFIVNAIEKSPAMFPRVLVVADEGSNATIVESYSSTSESVYFTNAVIELVLKDNARLTHYKLQRESESAFHIANTAAVLGRSSYYDSTAITLGGQLSRHDISVTMDAEGAECHVDGLYLVSTSQHADTHSVIDHRKPHCSSHQLYKGILDGKSRAVFNGKIFVRHDAQKTDAMQTNKNLLLSNEARIDTKPQLEILADDVKCAHGAAVGQIDEDEQFYLETRGINPSLARNLLTYGFAEEVIEKIKLDSIKRELDEVVLNRLQARLEV